MQTAQDWWPADWCHYSPLRLLLPIKQKCGRSLSWVAAWTKVMNLDRFDRYP
jgi:catalase (peroxidase I)